MFKTILGSAIALSVSSTPVMAAPAPFAAHSAATLSTAKSVRTGAATKDKSNLGGDNGFLIAIAGAIAIIVGVILIADDQDVATSS